MDERYLDFGGRVQSYERKQPQYKPERPKIQSMVGKLVMHDELGRGVVIEENNDILTIAFNRAGIKKVSRNFIKIID